MVCADLRRGEGAAVVGFLLGLYFCAFVGLFADGFADSLTVGLPAAFELGEEVTVGSREEIVLNDR